MRQTQCEITISTEDDDPQARADLSAINMQDWCEPGQYRWFHVNNNMATFERDFVRADGKFIWWDKPDSIQLGIWSSCMSDADGVFQKPMVLTATALPYYSYHLAIDLGNSGLRKYKIELYKENVKKREEVLTNDKQNDGSSIIINIPMTGYDKVVFTFLEAAPYTYLKFFYIGASISYTVSASELVSARSLVNYDHLANSLPIGILNFEISNTDQKFNALNPNNIYGVFRKGRAVHCKWKMSKGGMETSGYTGTYYLDSWENTNAASAKFKCVDALGLFDNIPIKLMRYNNDTTETADTYFQDIILLLAYIPISCQIEPEIAAIPLSGFINPSNARNALRDLCVATMSTVRITPENNVQIYRPKLEESITSSIGLKYGDEKITQHKYVDGVTVNYYTFNEKNYLGDRSWQFADTYQFKKFFSFTLEEAGIDENTVINDIDITVKSTTSTKPVLIKKRVWQKNGDISAEIDIDTQSPGTTATLSFKLKGIKIERQAQEVTVGEKTTNVIKDNTLITSETQAREIAQYWYDYYNTYGINIDYEAVVEPSFIVGEITEIETGLGMKYKHAVTSIQTNLTGGLTAKIKGVGKDVG